MSELFSNLGIEWHLLLAQIINFAILAYVLQRFVYKPIVASLEKRSAAIEKNSKISLEVESKLKETEELKEKVLVEARHESALLIKKAEESANKLKEEKLLETKREAEKLISQAKAQIENDRATLRSELKKEMGSLISLAVEKTVGDVIDQHAQKKLVAEAEAIIKEHKVKTQ